MQNNRGNFGWLSRSSNSLAEEQRMMVERQQEMIRNLNVNQRLALSSQQQIPSLFSLPMLASVNNVVPNQLSNLMLPGSLLPNNNLLSAPPMVPPPSVVPAPRVQSPPTISDSGLLKKSLYNDSGSRFFSSRNLAEEKLHSSSIRQSRFDDPKVDARSWDDEKWGQLGKGLIGSRPSSSKNRPEQHNFLNKTADQKDRGTSHRSNDSQSSRKWEDLGKTKKPFINPWADERETEPLRGWNQERNSDIARVVDSSYNIKPLEERGGRMDSKSSEDHQRRNRAKPIDVQLTSNKRGSEPDHRRTLEHQSWSSKSNQNKQSKWNDSQREYNDFRGSQVRDDHDCVWGNPKEKNDNIRSQVRDDHDCVWGNPKEKDDNIRSQERTLERFRSVNQFDRKAESSWTKRSGEEPEHGHQVKKLKMHDDKWFANSNRPEPLDWNSKTVEPKKVWSESSNIERKEAWLPSSRETDQNIWKHKIDDIWTEKSKIPESESWSKRSVETDMRRSNTWNSRSHSSDQKLPLKGNDLGLKVWDEKPRNVSENIWSRDKGEDRESHENLNRNRLGQNRSSDENETSGSRQSGLRREDPEKKQNRFVDDKLRSRKSRFDNDDRLDRQSQYSEGTSMSRQSRFSDDSSRPRQSRFSDDIPVARKTGVNDENRLAMNVKEQDKNILSSKRDNNLPAPPSNFLYPDPCNRSSSSDIWSRLDSGAGEENVSGTDTPIRFEENKRLQVMCDELNIRANSGNDADWEEAAQDNRIASIVQAGLAERVGYLDSQLEQLDQRMLEIYNTSSMMAAKEKPIPTLWEACGTTDLRVTLQKKAEANMAEINMGNINASHTVSSNLGGWTEDMVLIYPFMRHSSLSHVDISDLKSLLSKRIHSLLSSNHQNIQPRFLRSDYVNKGWFVIQCADEQSMNWLLKWKPTLTTKKRMNLCVRRAVDAVRVAHIEIYLPGVKESIKEIESRIHAQNEHLETYLWRRALHNPGRSGTTVGFLVDNACLKLLETNSWRIYYELSKATVKVLEHQPVPPMFKKRKG